MKKPGDKYIHILRLYKKLVFMFWVLIICITKILSKFMTIKFGLHKEIIKDTHILAMFNCSEVCSMIMNALVFESWNFGSNTNKNIQL